HGLRGSQAARIGGSGLGALVRKSVHVHVHLHLVLQDLDQLLHGGQVAGLQLGPHWHVCAEGQRLGYVCAEGHRLGHVCAEGQRLGYVCAEGHRLGYVCAEGHRLGYVCAEGHRLGHVCAEGHRLGYVCAEGQRLGYVCAEGQRLGYVCAEGQRLGYVCAEGHRLGYVCAEGHRQGTSAQEDANSACVSTRTLRFMRHTGTEDRELNTHLHRIQVTAGLQRERLRRLEPACSQIHFFPLFRIGGGYSKLMQ
ncbi:hypothetical protein ANANG_G00129610, partial [Anguilla anguilla]